ncbi:MAG: hypothetical protein QOF86_346 [Baekduia sp.]|nr:hypothetical protein [Baekduia sp.]
MPSLLDAVARTRASPRLRFRQFRWTAGHATVDDDHLAAWGTFDPNEDAADLAERAMTAAEATAQLARPINSGMREIIGEASKVRAVRYAGGVKESQNEGGKPTQSGSPRDAYWSGTPQWSLEVCTAMAVHRVERKTGGAQTFELYTGQADLLAARRRGLRLAPPSTIRRLISRGHPNWRAMPIAALVDRTNTVIAVRTEPPIGRSDGAVTVWVHELSPQIEADVSHPTIDDISAAHLVAQWIG